MNKHWTRGFAYNISESDIADRKAAYAKSSLDRLIYLATSPFSSPLSKAEAQRTLRERNISF